jgi:predicted DNA-binding transcriptional regulator YafY
MRNREFIRQWEILRTLDACRLGRTIHELAADTGVSTRTIRRDLAALGEAGFPVYCDEEGEATKRWKLDQRPFRGLEDNGFTLLELCALYFSRSLLECLAGTPFRNDLSQAFDKLQRVLTPQMRRFLDRLPDVLVAKGPAAPAAARRGERQLLARLVEASLDRRRARMRYHSFSSNRVKDYEVEPSQVVYGNGALYLLAFVPEYGEMRTFALDRIKRLSLLEDRFEPKRDLTREVFPNSLGVHHGPPVLVQLEFSARLSRYVQERMWHPSQRLEEIDDGRLRLSLEVCDDWALRTWILGFGAHVRVVAPSSLAQAILAEVEDARRQYQPRIEFELPLARFDDRTQRILPFSRAS